ncbi:RNA polymerase III subunit C82 [Stygiomarasmius scandens]|uniref:DNA-directed RNA polymerase III subunit RPC3 n=1 Tax=Marasmiellus scandens TaxID=2682957 RepID=A0ABR1IWZ1_9AGAR
MADELCTKIILQHFGPLTATVANTLLTKGRLTFPQLLRYTKLRPRTLRSCILVLVQHNVLWHTTNPDDGSEVVEFNVDECLVRLRFGTFVYLAEAVFGNAAGEIIQIILDHGKLTAPQILQHLGVSPSNAKIKSTSVYTQALHRLVSLRYLKPSTVLSHISPKDKLIQYESEEKAKISGFPTARQLREAKEMAHARLKKEEAEAEKIGLKKKPQTTKPNKRKTMSDDSNQDDTVVDETVYFRVSPEKFAIHLRNELIEKAAKERFNDGAALVMRAVLKITEDTQVDVSEAKTEPISISNIAMHLSSSEDEEKLLSGLIFPSSSKKVSNSTCIKEYLGMLSSADNPTPQGSAAKFLSTTRASSGRGGSGKIQVDFDIIAKRLRHRVLESVTREKHGVEGLRIVRLLLAEGKMDEKQIAKSMLMSQQAIRPILTSLSSDSLISTYPVPKTSDRNPTRTFYLWYVDLPTACSTLLDKMYKSLFNIYARREEEKESGGDGMVKKVLEKREREDVREAEERREAWLKDNAWLGEAAEGAAEEGLLSEWERKILSEWARKEEKLTVLETRVGESVFILKDLGRVLGAGMGVEDE